MVIRSNLYRLSMQHCLSVLLCMWKDLNPCCLFSFTDFTQHANFPTQTKSHTMNGFYLLISYQTSQPELHEFCLIRPQGCAVWSAYFHASLQTPKTPHCYIQKHKCTCHSALNNMLKQFHTLCVTFILVPGSLLSLAAWNQLEHLSRKTAVTVTAYLPTEIMLQSTKKYFRKPRWTTITLSSAKTRTILDCLPQASTNPSNHLTLSLWHLFRSFVLNAWHF